MKISFSPSPLAYSFVHRLAHDLNETKKRHVDFSFFFAILRSSTIHLKLLLFLSVNQTLQKCKVGLIPDNGVSYFRPSAGFQTKLISGIDWEDFFCCVILGHEIEREQFRMMNSTMTWFSSRSRFKSLKWLKLRRMIQHDLFHEVVATTLSSNRKENFISTLNRKASYLKSRKSKRISFTNFGSLLHNLSVGVVIVHKKLEEESNSNDGSIIHI